MKTLTLFLLLLCRLSADVRFMVHNIEPDPYYFVIENSDFQFASVVVPGYSSAELISPDLPAWRNYRVYDMNYSYTGAYGYDEVPLQDGKGISAVITKFGGPDLQLIYVDYNTGVDPLRTVMTTEYDEIFQPTLWLLLSAVLSSVLFILVSRAKANYL